MSGENWGGLLNTKNIDYDYRDLGRLLDPKHADNPPKWGCLIHPDEIRQVMAVGNGKFITTGGDQLQDYQLKNWIDLSIRSFGDQMQWDIYPKLWRHTPMPSDDPNRIIEDYAQIESAYDYRPSEANYFFLKLRHKPLHKLHKWELAYPFTGRHYLDLLPKAVPQYNLGILRAVFVQVPWSNAVPVQIGINAWRGLMQGGNFLPAAYLVDYTTGYSHASRVPAELKEILQDYITINIMSAFGDGIVGGMANYSTTIGILSESIGTTMSASIDYSDEVSVRKIGSNDVFNISIGLFFDNFKGKYNQYETLSVNPNNIKEFGWKRVLNAVEHDTTNKVCYEIKASNQKGSIKITEDHSLFKAEFNKLIEFKGSDIELSNGIAILDKLNESVYNEPVIKKEFFTPKYNKMYDLSVQDWENFVVNGSYVAHNTSAYFGARIMQLGDKIKAWWKARKSAYGGTTINFL